MFGGLIFRLIATWEACISGKLPPVEATQNEYYADIHNQYLLPTYKTDCTLDAHASILELITCICQPS